MSLLCDRERQRLTDQPCEFSEQPSLSVSLDTKVNFSAMHRYITRHLGVLLVTKGTLTYRNVRIISPCLYYFISITHFGSLVRCVAAHSSGFGDTRCSYSCLNGTHVVTVTALEEESREVKGSPFPSGPPRKGAALNGTGHSKPPSASAGEAAAIPLRCASSWYRLSAASVRRNESVSQMRINAG